MQLFKTTCSHHTSILPGVPGKIDKDWLEANLCKDVVVTELDLTPVRHTNDDGDLLTLYRGAVNHGVAEFTITLNGEVMETAYRAEVDTDSMWSAALENLSRARLITGLLGL